MTIHTRNNAPQYHTKDTSRICEIVHPNHSDAKNQSLAQATLAPGAKTQPHFHPHSEEIYFVLRGRAEFSLDGDVSTLMAGDAVVIPPGAPHQICNIGDEDLVFLCCCAPAYSHDDTILCDEIPSDER